MGRTAVIICNGDFPTKDYPLWILRNADIIVCCDGAFDKYLRASKKIFSSQRLPDAVIGDLDSISAAKKSEYAHLIVHDPDQETNDQTKAFRHILSAWPDVTEIHILGAVGGRVDHTIGNVSLLMEYARNYGIEEKGITVDIISDREIIIPVTDTVELQCGTGRKISIFSPDNSLGIKSSGLRWPTDGVVFDNWWKATLNVSSEDTVRLEFSHKSAALVIMN